MSMKTKLTLMVLAFQIGSMLGVMKNDYEDQQLLASMITAECSVCCEEEQYLVGSVILNRVDHYDFPNTLEEVINQRGQFDALDSEWFYPTIETEEIANNLLAGYRRDYNVLYFCMPNSPDQRFFRAMQPYITHRMPYHCFATNIDFR